MCNRDLEELFSTQYSFNRMVAPEAFSEDIEKRTAYVRNMTLAGMIELGEALNEWGWKPWSQRRGVDTDKYKAELADVMCFIINLALAAGLNAQDLFNATSTKQKINVERQRAGYTG